MINEKEYKEFEKQMDKVLEYVSTRMDIFYPKMIDQMHKDLKDRGVPHDIVKNAFYLWCCQKAMDKVFDFESKNRKKLKEIESELKAKA